MKVKNSSGTISTITRSTVSGMRIDPESTRFLLNALTDIYPDPTTAGLREYPTNALDSHIASGQTRPIEVTLPSAHCPYLVVQDWGLGMGFYELTEIYGVYGRSTKRESDVQLGAFGLGSKSALASIDAFSLITIKDGKKFRVLIQKDEHGVGEINIMKNADGSDHTETDEPNGVTVKIPVAEDMIASYPEKAERVFLMWKPGSVLVNGVLPKHIEDKDFHRVSDLGYMAYSGRHSVQINMGGLLYKVEGLDYSKLADLYRGVEGLRHKDVILTAKMSDVTIAPSRESILSTPENLRYVRTKLAKMHEYLVANARKDIEEAKDALEAISIIKTFAFLDLDKPSYRGEVYESNIAIEAQGYTWRSATGRRYPFGHNGKASLTVNSTAAPALFIDLDDQTNKLDGVLKHLTAIRKLHPDFAVNRNFYIGSWKNVPQDIFIKAMVEKGLIKIVTSDASIEAVLEARKANRKQRVASTGARGAITYPTYTHKGKGNSYYSEELSLKEIRELDGKVYVHHENDNIGTAMTLFETHGELHDTLITVSKTRSIESFTKRISDHVELSDYNDFVGAKIREGLVEVFTDNEESMFLLNSDWGTKNFVTNLGEIVDDLKSPFLRKLARYDSSGVSDRRAVNSRLRNMMRSMEIAFTDEDQKFFTSTDAASTAVENFMNHYRFAIDTANGHYFREFESLTIFLNAHYEAKGDVVF